MVRTVNGMLKEDTSIQARSPIVELVGPAGVGKTTLLRILCQRSEGIVAGVRPRIHQSENIPFFLRNAALLLPKLLRLDRNGTRFTRKEITVMVILNGWHRVLERQASRVDAVVVLDQGPIFRLAWLNEFGSEKLKSQSTERWWDSMYKQWAATLNMVIWLDAPDSILVKRIDARGKWHAVKGKSEQEKYEFLSRFRSSFQNTIARVAASGGPRVLRFNTGEQSLDQIADEVLAALGLMQPEGS